MMCDVERFILSVSLVAISAQALACSYQHQTQKQNPGASRHLSPDLIRPLSNDGRL